MDNTDIVYNADGFIFYQNSNVQYTENKEIIIKNHYKDNDDCVQHIEQQTMQKNNINKTNNNYLTLGSEKKL